MKTQSRAALEVECHPPCADALRGRHLLRVAPGAARAHPEVCVSRGEESCLSWNDPNRHVSLWAFSLFEVKRNTPPPSISLCSSSKEGSFAIRAEMSVQRPIAQRGDIPLLSPKGVMSKQATSCSISVWLNKEEYVRGRNPRIKEAPENREDKKSRQINTNLICRSS